MTYFTRAQWGALPSAHTGSPITRGPKGVAVHWNGPALKIDPAKPCDCARVVRGIQAYHIKVKGWADIAYDVLACPHGNVFQGRMGLWGTAAQDGPAANAAYMAVMALVGEGDPISDGLVVALRESISRLRAFGAGQGIFGHKTVNPSPTSCPGPDLSRLVTTGAIEPGLSPEPTPSTPPTRPPIKPTPPTPATLVLKVGSRGPLVTKLQAGLLRTFPSYAEPIRSAGGADGVFGKGTEAVVKEFQRRVGIASDGEVGPTTRIYLARHGIKI
jgi:hypothetical protein